LSGKDYLDRQYSEYCKLIENSNLIDRKIMDKLAQVSNDLVQNDSKEVLSIEGSEEIII
jgi:hypothetical protein